MAQIIIVDGYNVIHQIKQYKDLLHIDLETARKKLIHDLKIYKFRKKVSVILVFDGAADIPIYYQEREISGLEIIYSRAPIKADPVIKEKISSRNKKDQMIVVTDDGDIRRFSQSYGAIVLSPVELYSRITDSETDMKLKGKYENSMTPDELELWKKLFGIS
ncbi:NYN domain-containing protein [candidate division KSB1 bacterium]|nr:NYN domain-containing protein [candidate division KSB1 bacterium]